MNTRFVLVLSGLLAVAVAPAPVFAGHHYGYAPPLVVRSVYPTHHDRVGVERYAYTYPRHQQPSRRGSDDVLRGLAAANLAVSLADLAVDVWHATRPPVSPQVVVVQPPQYAPPAMPVASSEGGPCDRLYGQEFQTCREALVLGGQRGHQEYVANKIREAERRGYELGRSGGPIPQ